MSRDLGYRAVLIAGNVPFEDLPEQLGEWQVRSCDRSAVGGRTDDKDFWFGCPFRHIPCVVPLLPAKNPNGSGWRWDGQTPPTLTPSINCQKPSGCGWHGIVEQGRFR